MKNVLLLTFTICFVMFTFWFIENVEPWRPSEEFMEMITVERKIEKQTPPEPLEPMFGVETGSYKYHLLRRLQKTHRCHFTYGGMRCSR